MGCCTMEPGWPGLCVFLEPATWGMSPFWKRTTSIFWVTLTQVKTSLGAKSQEKKIRPHKGPRPWKNQNNKTRGTGFWRKTLGLYFHREVFYRLEE